MDRRDEFSKWITAVESALSNNKEKVEENAFDTACGCGNWDCPECFPDTDGSLDGFPGPEEIVVIGAQDQDCGCNDSPELTQQGGIGMAGAHPVDGDTFDHNPEDDIDVTLLGVEEETVDECDVEQDTKPRFGGDGVRLGDIVQKFVPADKKGEESPLSYGNELEEDSDINADEVINKIMYMQSMGLSNGSKQYSEQELATLPPEQLKIVQQEVLGNVTEQDKPKPTKTRAFDPDLDLDGDITNPRQAQPIANVPHDDGEYNDTIDGPGPTPHMPRASAADTRSRTANINPSDLMRDYMNRIDPTAGGDEPELADEPVDQENAIVATTAADVPAVISNAMRVAGVEMPLWHTVNNLPGYRQQNIRGMGRQVFSMFTSTPLEQIQTIANVDGQGPNTDAELRAVGNWLKNNAEDLGKVELNHGRAVPGYRPDVKEYRINGVRFHVVRDPMGQYIYAYPDADARLNTGNPQVGNNTAPRIREGTAMINKLSISEAIKFDDIIKDGLRTISESYELDESSLSKLIGKQKGGQRLVHWLHSKHKLGNEANLEPQPFSERMLWKEFKRNPDNFVIVSATNGVAGIKPYEQMIKDRMAAAQKKGKSYDPGGDSTLQYQIIAFTDDGKQVDPALLQPKPEAGEERDEDPTVMKARMGKISGKDTQNPDNVFNLLADQIGTLRTVYVASGAVERDKIKQRADRNAPEKEMSEDDAVKAIFKRVRPVLKSLAMQAKSTLMKRIQRYNEGGNFEGAQKLAAAGAKLTQFLATIDTSNDVNIDTSWGSSTRDFSGQVKRALSAAAGAPVGSDQYKKYLNAAAKGNAVALKPILDAFRDSLVALQ